MLDIGTGSGCIGISLLKYCPDITLECIDISEKALEVAKENAIRNGVSDRIKFTLMDILNEVPDKKYDVVVSNPPYIRPDVIEGLECQVKDFEPYLALYGGDDGLLFYKRITAIAPCILNEDGTPSVLYDYVKEINAEVQKFARVYQWRTRYAHMHFFGPISVQSFDIILQLSASDDRVVTENNSAVF